MPDPTPRFNEVVYAVVQEIEAIDPAVGPVYWFENPLEDESEFLELNQQVIGSITVDLDIFFVFGSVRSIEGPASGEFYSMYDITVLYQSVRLVDDWSDEAKKIAEVVRTKLEGNSAVFAIDGQRALLETSSEAVSANGGSFENIAGHQVYQIPITLSVEARRWLTT